MLITGVQYLEILRASSGLDFTRKGPDMVCHCFYMSNVLFCVLGAQDSSLKLWDLRKLKNFKTITLDNNYEVRNYILFLSLLKIG